MGHHAGLFSFVKPCFAPACPQAQIFDLKHQITEFALCLSEKSERTILADNLTTLTGVPALSRKRQTIALCPLTTHAVELIPDFSKKQALCNT